MAAVHAAAAGGAGEHSRPHFTSPPSPLPDSKASAGGEAHAHDMSSDTGPVSAAHAAAHHLRHRGAAVVQTAAQATMATPAIVTATLVDDTQWAALDALPALVVEAELVPPQPQPSRDSQSFVGK